MSRRMYATVEHENTDLRITTLKASCAACGMTHFASVRTAEIRMYQGGTPVQEAFRALPASARELFFLSGICGSCWDALFAEED